MEQWDIEQVEQLTLRESIRRHFVARPLLFSIACFLAVAIGRFLFIFVIVTVSWFGNALNSLVSPTGILIRFFNLDFFFRYLFSIPAIVLIGIAAQKKGFAFVFSLKGFGKGLLATSPLWALTFIIALSIITTYDLSMDFANTLPVAIFNEFARGLWEEVLFRGILMTAVLVGMSRTWDKNLKMRLVFIIVCGAFFGFIHFPTTWYLALFFCSVGIILCATYAYSKNLLSCILWHAVGNAIIYFLRNSTIPALTTDFMHSMHTMHMAILVSICIIGLALAIFLSVKAEPFEVKNENI